MTEPQLRDLARVLGDTVQVLPYTQTVKQADVLRPLIAHADMKALAEFSPMRSPLKLKGLKFREFFEWLSQSVSTTSQSIAGESISLDFEGIKGWAEL